MKKTFLSAILIGLILSAKPCLAQYLPTIPTATLQAAQQAVIKNSPTSQVVRVGIGTSNFGTYQYNDITIFGTGDTQIYDNRMLIGNYPANQNIRIIQAAVQIDVTKNICNILSGLPTYCTTVCPTYLLSAPTDTITSIVATMYTAPVATRWGRLKRYLL